MHTCQINKRKNCKKEEGKKKTKTCKSYYKVYPRYNGATKIDGSDETM